MYLFLDLKNKIKNFYIKIFGLVLWTMVNGEALAINDTHGKTLLALCQYVPHEKAVIGVDQFGPVLRNGWHWS